MTEVSLMDRAVDTERTPSWPVRIAAAWIVGLVALTLAGWIGEIAQTQFGIAGRLRQGLHALVMSGIALPGIWWLRTRFDRRSMAGLGFPDVRTSLIHFGSGVGLVAVPMLLTIVATLAFGWSRITVDVSASGIGALAAGILTVLFFEAIPEETIFRGYIYSNLSLVTRRWVAGAATVALFAVLPIAIHSVQTRVLGMSGNLGGSDSVTAEYVVMILLFGSFIQYLRIASGSVWLGIGFHAAFVLMNRILSPRPTAFIHLVDVVNSQAIQLTLLGSLLLMLVAALLYPRVRGRKRRLESNTGHAEQPSGV